MKRMKMMTVAAAVAMPAVLLLSGCGGGNSDSGKESTTGKIAVVQVGGDKWPGK